MFMCDGNVPEGSQRLVPEGAKERGANPPSVAPASPSRDEGDPALGPGPRHHALPSWMKGKRQVLGSEEAFRGGLALLWK